MQATRSQPLSRTVHDAAPIDFHGYKQRALALRGAVLRAGWRSTGRVLLHALHLPHAALLAASAGQPRRASCPEA